jgi:hypothetical protein
MIMACMRYLTHAHRRRTEMEYSDHVIDRVASNPDFTAPTTWLTA